jgi:hypothetical protein
MNIYKGDLVAIVGVSLFNRENNLQTRRVLTPAGSLSPTARKSCHVRMDADSRVKVRGTHSGTMAPRMMT